MRSSTLLLLVATALVGSPSAFAQGNPQQAPAPQKAPATDTEKPRELTVAPDAPKQTPETSSSSNQGSASSTGVPANICAELVAYFRAKDQPQSGAQAKPAQQTAGPGQTAPPMDRPQQQSGQSAPIPPSDRSTTSAQVSVDQAQSLLQAGDLRGCRKTVREMRRAGVALPPGLLALAALREDLLLRAGENPSAR